MSVEIGKAFTKCGKDTNTKFRENPSDVIRVVPCGQTDRQTHDEVCGCYSLAKPPEMT
jgi:hypothetical protein